MRSLLRRHALAAALMLSPSLAVAQQPAPRTPVAPEPPQAVVPAPPVADLPAAPVPATAAPAATPCDCAPFDWAKVPSNLRPLPRLGWFGIPPERCGYFSVVDVFRGKLRDKAPPAPFPAISPSPGSFFDADYRFLDDPKNTDRDWTDFTKRIKLGDNWMLSTGGEFRYRLMDEIGARLTAVDDNHHLFRTRVYGDLWYRDRFRFYIEMLDAHITNPDLPPLGIDVNTADLQNLFVDMKVLDRFGAPAYVRVGRQELTYGSQRLISPLDWANTRRTFDGAKVFWTQPKWDVDLFWVKPVPVDPAGIDGWDLDQNFYGVWATYKPKKGTTRDFYLLNLHQNRPVAVGAGGLPGGFYYTTFGTRWAGDQDGRFLYDFEGMAQTGIRANEGVFAFATTAGVGYRAKKLRWNPTVWAYYDFASGTPDPAVAGRTQTFNPLFPFGHYYLGYQDFVGRSNIHDFNLQASINPAPFATFLFQYHHFALAQARDALYNAAGAVLRQDPTGASGQNVGDEFDVLANIHINRHHDVLFGVSMFAPGQFLRNAPGGVPTDPKLYYLQYSYKW